MSGPIRGASGSALDGVQSDGDLARTLLHQREPAHREVLLEHAATVAQDLFEDE